MAHRGPGDVSSDSIQRFAKIVKLYSNPQRLFLISTLFGVLAFFSIDSEKVGFWGNFTISLLVSVVTGLLQIVIEIIPKIDSFSDILSVSVETSRQQRFIFSLTDDLFNKIHELHKQHRVIRLTLVSFLEKYIKSIQPTSTGLAIQNKTWLLIFNQEFWTNLTDFQRERRFGHSLDVKITHQAHIRFWSDDDADESIRAQQAFCAAGGTITRVFVGPMLADDVRRAAVDHSIDGDAQHYANVMLEMSERGINTIYVSGLTYKYDYTWVPSENILMQWWMTVGGEQITSYDIAYDPEEVRRVEEHWRQLTSRRERFEILAKAVDQQSKP